MEKSYNYVTVTVGGFLSDLELKCVHCQARSEAYRPALWGENVGK